MLCYVSYVKRSRDLVNEQFLVVQDVHVQTCNSRHTIIDIVTSSFLSPWPTLILKSFDKHAAYRFLLAFQCIVNIGIRGSELIRSRVVQAGPLDVVGCILEPWLASKGFAVGPTSSAMGMSRETRLVSGYTVLILDTNISFLR